MHDEVIDPNLRELLAERRDAARHQMHGLDIRLRALGREPSGGPGLFQRALARVWDALHRPSGAADTALQDVLKAFGIGQFKGAVYHAVTARARLAGDVETAELAEVYLRDERAAAERFQGYICQAVGRLTVVGR